MNIMKRQRAVIVHKCSNPDCRAGTLINEVQIPSGNLMLRTIRAGADCPYCNGTGEIREDVEIEMAIEEYSNKAFEVYT